MGMKALMRKHLVRPLLQASKGRAMSSTRFDTVIIGGGPAGLSAAIYAGRASLSALVVEQGMPGGQIATTDEIENYPGIPSISGAELGLKLQEHAEKFGASIAYGSVERIERNEDGTFTVSYSSESATASTVIYTGGAIPRLAGFKGEDAFRGRGVSYCATCDGMFYRNKHVFVIGGGNSACEEALFLTKFASQVTMVVRRDKFRAPKGVSDRVMAHDKIDVRFNTKIVAADGDALLNTVTFEDTVTSEQHTETYEEGSFGIFVFAGYMPQTDLVAELVDLGPAGGVVTDERMRTKTPGLFCAGDVREKPLRQVVTAVSDGAVAAVSAYDYLDNL